jgi:tRNA(Ile)-lysidine synthase
MAVTGAQELVKKVDATIREHQMFAGVANAVIAFSAGPDSVCLLDVLFTIFKGTIDFELVYVNHGLRPQSTLRREESIVKDYAMKYGARHKILAAKVKKKGLGVEAAARAARYGALLSHLEETGAARIALGHNLDDFVETFLMNFIRGSGMTGLTSIRAKRLPFVRPMLNCKKADIINYLKSKKLKYATDMTNRSLDFRRNILRVKVLPILEKLNPEIHETVRRECQILKYDDDHLWEEANRLYRKAVRFEKDCAVLDTARLMRYNLSVTIRVVMKALSELRGDLAGYESKHYYAITSLTTKMHSKRISLPKGMYAQREYQNIVIGRTKPSKDLTIPVDINDGWVLTGDVRLRMTVEKGRSMGTSADNRESFDLDQLCLPLYVRKARSGDIVQTSAGRKKLKKVYSEHRIAPRKRSSTLLLCDQIGILWVLGIRRASRGMLNDKTERTLVVEYECPN